MTECSEIEAGGEVRTIKDATARQGVATNAAAIDEIKAVIPSSASAANKIATQEDIRPALDYINETPIQVTANVINPTIANEVYCYPKQKKIHFYLGSGIQQDLTVATFTLPEGFTFNQGGWGTIFQATARSGTTGSIMTIPVSLQISNRVGRLLLNERPQGYEEIRILNVTVFSHP